MKKEEIDLFNRETSSGTMEEGEEEGEGENRQEGEEREDRLSISFDLLHSPSSSFSSSGLQYGGRKGNTGDGYDCSQENQVWVESMGLVYCLIRGRLDVWRKD